MLEFGLLDEQKENLSAGLDLISESGAKKALFNYMITR
jgi:hypothetical protein